MCGICGFTWNDKGLLSRMTGKLAHRGPDSDGMFEDDGISLGHRRLAIIDLSEKGRQPMQNKEGTVWLTFNGEIYNFKRLREELERKGHRFASDSDTETIIYAYEEFGDACVKHLDGQFAFAIWDSKRRRLFCARDRLGVKPFYYAIHDKKIIFASEIKAILEYERFSSPRVDPVALDRYFTYRYTPGDDTVFAGIKKLRPGNTLTFQNGKAIVQPFWTLVYSPNAEDVEKNAGMVRKLLEKAVKDRMVSDVPLGAYLSGGLDSSAVVALMAKHSPDQIRTFSVSFPYEKEDEGRYARLVSEAFGTDHHELSVKKDAFDVLPKVVWHLDEPLADASCIPTYLMSELTKKHVTVVLSGEGSDELFAGYNKYKYAMLARYARHAPSIVMNLLSNSGTSILLRRLASIAAAGSDEESYERLAAVFSDEEKEEAYTHDFLSTTADANKTRPWKTEVPTTSDMLSMMLATDTKTWLPDDLLLKGDKMTLAHAIEARTPFLDYHLVEVAAAIPPQQKLHVGTDKFVYRKAVSAMLPKEIVKRKKHGFMVPIDAWLQKDLKDAAQHALTDPGVLKYLNRAAVDKALARHAKHIYYRRQLWTMLNFALWHRIFIEQADPKGALR